MKKLLFISMIVFLYSCSKKKEIIPPEPPHIPEQWGKFIGNYKVYDTIGNYMYDMQIKYLSTIHFPNGNQTDSLILQNFADTFDLKIGFNPASSGYENTFAIGIHDSIVDKNNKSWSLSGLSDDPNTTVIENKLFNDTLIFYFQQTNIQYYINEAQPYFFCKCKQVAVKQ